MKNKLLYFALLLFSNSIHAQDCKGSFAHEYLHANTIGAKIYSGGQLFNESGFIPNPAADSSGPSTIYVASLWLGGFDQGLNIRLFAPTYSSNGGGPFAGPLNDTGFADSLSCSNWDQLFKISGARVREFLQALPGFAGNAALAIQQFPEIMGWPAKDNSYFAGIQGFDLPPGKTLAPFFDQDGDAVYNPMVGDYPVVQLANTPPFVPAEWVWSVYNSVGAANQTTFTFPVELQLSAWAFNCADQPALNNTIFTAHKVLFSGTEALDSCLVGMFADMDIGCPEDDYIGCGPDLNAFFAYNQDDLDGDIGFGCSEQDFYAPFGGAAPVQSVTYLNWSMDKFNYFNSVSYGNPPATTTDPSTPAEHYNYLTGHWRDGRPLTWGGSGYSVNGGVATNFAVPGDPSDPNAWSMCREMLTKGDRRGLGTHYLGTVQPGMLKEFVTAWSYHPNPNLPCGLGTTYTDIAEVRSIHTAGFATVCSPLTAAQEPNADLPTVELFPNPVGQLLYLRFGTRSPLAVRLFDLNGRLLYSASDVSGEQISLPVHTLADGLYTLECLFGQRTILRKVVIQHSR